MILSLILCSPWQFLDVFSRAKRGFGSPIAIGSGCGLIGLRGREGVEVEVDIGLFEEIEREQTLLVDGVEGINRHQLLRVKVRLESQCSE